MKKNEIKRKRVLTWQPVTHSRVRGNHTPESSDGASVRLPVAGLQHALTGECQADRWDLLFTIADRVKNWDALFSSIFFKIVRIFRHIESLHAYMEY